jgi:hypothetical protein
MRVRALPKTFYRVVLRSVGGEEPEGIRRDERPVLVGHQRNLRARLGCLPFRRATVAMPRDGGDLGIPAGAPVVGFGVEGEEPEGTSRSARSVLEGHQRNPPFGRNPDTDRVRRMLGVRLRICAERVSA